MWYDGSGGGRVKLIIRGHVIGWRFRRAYALLYRGRITAYRFCATCGIDGRDEAWATLREFRERVITGEVKDPRDRLLGF